MLPRTLAGRVSNSCARLTRSNIRRASSGPAYQPPTAPSQQKAPNPHRTFYREFGLPVTKVFLGALFTYQVMYWSWLKLESIESGIESGSEIKRLEERVEELKDQKKEVKT